MFAVIKNGFVENIAEAESLLIIRALLPEKEVMQETKSTGFAWIGSEVIDGKFKPPQPFPSWSFDSVAFAWKAPVEKPNDSLIYYWSENQLEWVEIVYNTEPLNESD